MKKIKILMYADRWNSGGIEAFIMNVYRNINHKKFGIDILVAQNESDMYDEEIKKIGGIKQQILDKKIKSPVMRNIKNIIMFKKKLKNTDYDIIHINIGNGVGLIYAFLARKVGIKRIIVHSHNSDIGNKNRFIKKLAHNICKIIFQDIPTDYLACSDKAAKWLYTKKILNEERVKIINNAIDIDKYIYNEEKRIKFREENDIGKAFVIGHIGRFNEQKNHRFLIEIFEKVQQRINDSYLFLVGEGELEEEIKKLVKERQMENNVIFYGITKDIQKCLSGFDMLVLPSLYEGNPIVGIEAQASGLYCIFSDRITKSAKITENVKFLPLEENTQFWANEIIKSSKKERKIDKEKIMKAGYDMKTLINSIENIYSKM